jgi:hypothetical protein
MRGGLAFQVVCSGVAWLVDRQISAARELNRGEQTPAFVTDRVGDRDVPGGQVRQRLLDVVAHQVELVLPQPVSGVYGDLGWRQLEDQPATADVNPAESEYVADEDPVGLRVGAVEDDMCSVDQGSPRSFEETKESRMSIAHSPHEWLVRCSHVRVNPGMAWTGLDWTGLARKRYAIRHTATELNCVDTPSRVRAGGSMPNNAAVLMRGPSFLVGGLLGS